MDIANLNQKALTRVIASLVEKGELHIVFFQPPGYPENDVPMELRFVSSSPTAWAELKKAVTR